MSSRNGSFLMERPMPVLSALETLFSYLPFTQDSGWHPTVFASGKGNILHDIRLKFLFLLRLNF